MVITNLTNSVLTIAEFSFLPGGSGVIPASRYLELRNYLNSLESRGFVRLQIFGPAGTIGSSGSAGISGTSSGSSGSSGTTKFDPSQVSGLVLWLRSDLGITKDGGDLVSTWADQSGQGNDATQGANQLKPTFTANYLSGYPAISFNGSQYFSADGLATILSGNDVPYSAFVVFQDDDTSVKRTLLAGWGTLGNPSDDAIQVVINKLLISRDDDFGTPKQVLSTSTIGASNHYMSAIVIGTTLSTWLDGVQNANGTNFNVGQVTLTNGWIGAANNPSNPEFIWSGKIIEVIVYNSALSTLNRQLIENYLSTRYGL